MKSWKKNLEFAVGLVLTISLLPLLGNEFVMSINMRVFSKLSIGMVVKSIILIRLLILVCRYLVKCYPKMGWSLASLFNQPQMNFNLLPMKIRYVGPVFLLLLIILAPMIATIEESWFRKGITSWQQGVFRSVLFGLAHFVTGISFAGCFAIALAGMWFTHQYFVGGIESSILYHTAYNGVLFLILFAGVIHQHFVYFRDKRAARKLALTQRSTSW